MKKLVLSLVIGSLLFACVESEKAILTDVNSPDQSLTLSFFENDEVIFRVFNDGIGFRYVLPQQENRGAFAITDEYTQFKLTDDHTAWWIPADYDSYEYLYSESKLSEIDASQYDVQLAANTIMENHATATS